MIAVNKHNALDTDWWWKITLKKQTKEDDNKHNSRWKDTISALEECASPTLQGGQNDVELEIMQTEETQIIS